jgi:hypothetical protein
MEMTMRTTILMTPFFVLMASGAAFAQSHQGGYLGKNPAATQDTASQERVAPPALGSGQGGYLGANAGANQLTASQQPSAPPAAQGSHEGGYLGSVPGTRR